MAEKRMTLPTMEEHADELHPVPPKKSYIGRMIDAAAGLAAGGPTNKITDALNGPAQSQTQPTPAGKRNQGASQ
jgi:hypothetical protein